MQIFKGPSFHTDAFMQGYYDGFDSCTNNAENIPSQEETFKIDATIDFDRQAILEADGNNLGNAWFTINGQRYGEEDGKVFLILVLTFPFLLLLSIHLYRGRLDYLHRSYFQHIG